MPNKRSPKTKTIKTLENPSASPKKERKRRKIVLKKKIKPLVYTEMDDISKRINHVQIRKEESSILVSVNDSATIENVLRDAGLEWDRNNKYNGVNYIIKPSKRAAEASHALESLEELDDEILEDGQIFD